MRVTAEPVSDVLAALAAIDAAHEQLLATLNSCPDPGRALALASHANSHMQGLFQRTSATRSGIIEGIYRADKPSLSQLAGLVGVSKSRADQYVRRFTGRSPAGSQSQQVQAD